MRNKGSFLGAVVSGHCYQLAQIQPNGMQCNTGLFIEAARWRLDGSGAPERKRRRKSDIEAIVELWNCSELAEWMSE